MTDRLSDQIDPDLWYWIHGLPKAELHVHLEGAIRRRVLHELAVRNELSIPHRVQKNLEGEYKFRDFSDFGNLYLDIVSLIKTAEDFELVVYGFGEQMRDDGIKYAEVTWTPQLHVSDEQGFKAWLHAAERGRVRAETDFGVKIRWIIDICRDRYQGAEEVARWATSPAAKDASIVALGLGGTELNFPWYLFKEAFEIAQAHGLRAVPHAGEHPGNFGKGLGPAAVKDAMTHLKAFRIGHGNRAIEDHAVVRRLAEEKITLDLCPTSNVRLGTYESLERHPFRRLLNQGCHVTINTDDPGIFDISLTDEVFACANAFQLSRREIAQILSNSFEAAVDQKAISSIVGVSELKAFADGSISDIFVDTPETAVAA